MSESENTPDFRLRPASRADIEDLQVDLFSRFGGEGFDKLKRRDAGEIEALIDSGLLWCARLEPRPTLWGELRNVVRLREKEPSRGAFIGTAYVAAPDEDGAFEFGGAAILPQYRGLYPGLALDLGACCLASFILNTGGVDHPPEIISHVHADNPRVARLIERRGGFERVREIALDPAVVTGFDEMPVAADGKIHATEYRLTDAGRVKALGRAKQLVPVHGLESILPLEDIEGLIARLGSGRARP